MTINQDFGHFVKYWRKQRGYTLPQLASLAGISKGLLSKIENEQGNPTIETVQKLTIALARVFYI